MKSLRLKLCTMRLVVNYMKSRKLCDIRSCELCDMRRCEPCDMRCCKFGDMRC